MWSNNFTHEVFCLSFFFLVKFSSFKLSDSILVKLWWFGEKSVLSLSAHWLFLRVLLFLFSQINKGERFTLSPPPPKKTTTKQHMTRYRAKCVQREVWSGQFGPAGDWKVVYLYVCVWVYFCVHISFYLLTKDKEQSWEKCLFFLSLFCHCQQIKSYESNILHIIFTAGWKVEGSNVIWLPSLTDPFAFLQSSTCSQCSVCVRLNYLIALISNRVFIV